MRHSGFLSMVLYICLDIMMERLTNKPLSMTARIDTYRCSLHIKKEKMQERIVEIIIYLVGELRLDKRLHEVDLSSLMRQGYTQGEISKAFSWFFERMIDLKNPSLTVQAKAVSHRQLNDAERMMILPDAFGYLIQCAQLGLLGNAEIESVIDTIMGSGLSALGISEMKTLIAGHIFDPGRMNSKLIFGSNDTIH
jgi:uncharacterized protein Smg (DUF494 family)